MAAENKKEETTEELINRLENTFVSESNKLVNLRDRYNELQSEIISQQEKVFKALQQLSGVKENLLVRAIKDRDEQLKTKSTDDQTKKPQGIKQVRAKVQDSRPVVVEETDDSQ